MAIVQIKNGYSSDKKGYSSDKNSYTGDKNRYSSYKTNIHEEKNLQHLWHSFRYNKKSNAAQVSQSVACGRDQKTQTCLASDDVE